MGNSTWTTPIPQSPWKVIFLSPIIVLSIIAQLMLFCVVRSKSTLRHMSYYYLLSLGALHSTMAVIAAPLEVFMEFTGEIEPYESTCSIWVTLDTFFCNNIFLHLLGASLDAMLKTHNPFKYSHPRPRGTTLLKLGAPWTISIVQSTAMFAISQPKSGVLEGYVCFLNDSNFQVLRFLLAFLCPLLTGFTIYLISVLELSRHRSKTYLEDFDKTSEIRGLFRSPSSESLNTMETRSPDFESPTQQNSGLINYSERIFTMKKGLEMYGETMADDDDIPCDCKRRKKRHIKGELQEDGADVIVELTAYHECHCPNFRSRFTGPHSTTQSTYIGLSDIDSTGSNLPAPPSEDQLNSLASEFPPKSIRHRQIYLRRLLHSEEKLTKILAVLYTVNLSLWAPYIIGHLLRSTCPTCAYIMNNSLFRNFKWAAYFSCIFNPFIYMVVNRDIRRGYVDLLRGRCH
ncbi:alpha-2Db adrenergic receptor-like [Tubulanus polymorphus]|uniref:alpha-2Db adrenergic receptor-like n=1 Tax=Tubulanus polymorphus TaxID=672921 RepID=UPI003DA21D2C